MTKARDQLIQRACEPRSVNFNPVPYKLVEVINTRGEEYSTHDTPKPYDGERFDPWRRGDLVVVERIHKSYSTNFKLTTSSTWHVGRRHTTPGATRQQIALNTEGYYRVEPSRDCKLWRIVLRYLSSAEKLIGREFATREDLEAALENPSLATFQEAA